jgi:alpha-glucosidase
LPGQVFLYQGEELGLEEVDVPPPARQDPLYIHTEGQHPGRDGCRVPLPWKRGEPNAGFSVAAPWLPMPVGWDSFAVDGEEASATSMLSFYKRALALRRRLAPWLPASFMWQAAPEGVLAYRRERLMVACNFLSRPVTIHACGRLVLASAPLAKVRDGRLTLPASSAAWLDSVGT